MALFSLLSLLLNASRDGHATTFPGSIFQYLITLYVKKLFLMSNLNLPRHIFHLAGQQNTWVFLFLQPLMSVLPFIICCKAGTARLLGRVLGGLMSERWWGARMLQSWRSCEYVRQAGWDLKALRKLCWKLVTSLFLCPSETFENTVLWWQKSPTSFATAPLKFWWEKGVEDVLAGLWLACTEEFSPISVVSCCTLQSLTLPFSIQTLLLRSSFTHGRAE